jgi:hypothetical protein
MDPSQTPCGILGWIRKEQQQNNTGEYIIDANHCSAQRLSRIIGKINAETKHESFFLFVQ